MRSAAARSQSASSPAGLRRTWLGAPRWLTEAYIGPSFRRRWIALSLDSPGARGIGIEHGDRPRETRTTAAHVPHRRELCDALVGDRAAVRRRDAPRGLESLEPRIAFASAGWVSA